MGSFWGETSMPNSYEITLIDQVLNSVNPLAGRRPREV